MSKTLYLVDASGYVFRSYYALPLMKREDGVAVQAVYGFVGMLLKLLDRLAEDDLLGVVFDVGGDSFRKQIYAEYKSNRPPPPEDLIPQFSLVREATRAFGLEILEKQGFEADDVIASYARWGENLGYDVIIASSDKDMMQLVSDRVKMYDSIKDREVGIEEVVSKYGVEPSKMVDFQALAGDSSDNIPGVPGIGAKIAAQLLQEYNSLDELLQRANEIKQTKRRESLINHRKEALMSRELARLKTDMDLEIAIELLTCKNRDSSGLSEFLHKQGFRRFLRKIAESENQPRSSEQIKELSVDSSGGLSSFADNSYQYELVLTENDLKIWIEKARTAGVLAIDTETTSLDVMKAELVGVSIATKGASGGTEACYIPLAHCGEDTKLSSSQEQYDLFAVNNNQSEENQYTQLPLETVLSMLSHLFVDESVMKIGQNIKYDLKVLSGYGIEVYPKRDTMLMSFVLDAGRELGKGHGLDTLAEKHLNYETIKFKDIVNKSRNRRLFSEVSLNEACDYAAEDADITLRLYEKLKNRLDLSSHNGLYYEIELALIDVLSRMESFGIMVDVTLLESLSREFLQREQDLEKQVYEISGQEFVLSSPKQVSYVLFDVMGLNSGGKTGTGENTTRKSVLEDLAREGHKIAILLLEWREINKLRSTYTDSLAKGVIGGRVHTTYAMTGARTGRLSSHSPNLQNIPIRTKEGREIRKAFIAPENKQLISFDYNQIELRLLADFAEEHQMQQAFHDGIDIHSLTASRMFGVELENMDKNLRRRAKEINFGIIYGISAYGLSRRIGIGNREAKEFIDAYFVKFPRLKKYVEDSLSRAREQGYVATVFGRRLYIDGLDSKNRAIRQHAERQAINAPIQGTAADIIKLAMIRIDRKIIEEKLDSKMILQVHDEIVFEVPNQEREQILTIVGSEMERAVEPLYKLSVPLRVDSGIGQNWEEAH